MRWGLARRALARWHTLSTGTQMLLVAVLLAGAISLA